MNLPMRPTRLGGKLWEDVDATTGQAISFSHRIFAVEFHVYTADSSTYVNTFTISPNSTEIHSDDLVIGTNPYAVSIAALKDETLFTIKAASGETVDVYAVILA